MRERFLRHDSSRRFKQKVTEPHGKTTNHDALRIQNVDENRQRGPELFTTLRDDASGKRIPLRGRQAHVPCGDLAIGGKFKQLARFPLFSCRSYRGGRPLRDSPSTDPPFRGASFVIADRTIGGEAHMPDLSSHTIRSLINSVTKYDACAEARSHREEDHVV